MLSHHRQRAVGSFATESAHASLCTRGGTEKRAGGSCHRKSPQSPVNAAPLLFGQTDHRRQFRRCFGIFEEDLRHHMLILGKTGSGKSVLLEHLVLGLVRKGAGVGLLDPHGDLVASVLERLPRARTNDVCLIDATDTEAAVPLNPLGKREGIAPSLLVAQVLSVFRKAYAEAWGPRLEHVFRSALFALSEHRDVSLLAAVRMLTEESYRRRVVDRLQDPLTKHFWEREYPQYAPSFRAEMASPVLNKVATALASPVVRNMVGQLGRSFSAREAMDLRRIVLQNVAKGTLGEGPSAFLGSLLLTSFQLGAYARASQIPEQRVPFTLVVDELASFATPSFMELLAEARKFRLGLVLATQSLGNLEPNLQRALLGNVGTLVLFRMGPEDAALLEPFVVPELCAQDLADLAPHRIVVRLSVRGVMSRPFTAYTNAPAQIPADAADPSLVRRVSRERYATPKARAEAQIRAQLDR